MNDQAYIRRGLLTLRKNRAYLTEQSKQPWVSKLLKKRIVEWQRQIPTRNNQITWQTKHQFALAESELTDEYIHIRDKVHQAHDEYRRSLTPIVVSSSDYEDEDQAFIEDIEDQGSSIPVSPSLETQNVPSESVSRPDQERTKNEKGAGRKSIGASKRLKLVLPQTEWDHIDRIIEAKQQHGTYSYSAYFRDLHYHNKQEDQQHESEP